MGYLSCIQSSLVYGALMGCLWLTGCAGSADPYPCYDHPEATQSTNDILVIGDSISIGYTPTVRSDMVNHGVIHNPCNAMNTIHSKLMIDQWLSLRPRYAAITFNNGLWDIAEFARVYHQDYRDNLRILARKIKEHTDHPLFILTTPVPLNTPYRTDERVVAYNRIANQVMIEEGIPVLDLYTYGQSISNLQLPNDVHWTTAGSQALGHEVSAQLQLMGL